MNKSVLIGVILLLSVIGLGIGFLSNSRKTVDTSILGTGVVSDRAVEARPTEAPTPTAFIYLSPTTVVPLTYKFGETVSLKNDRYLTIFQPISDYKQEGNQPPSEYGKKYVIVEGVYENKGYQKVACDPYFNIKLIDDKGNIYDSNGPRVKLPALDCTPDMPDPAYIQPNNSLRGFISFSINREAEPAKIKYKSFQYDEEVYFSGE